MTSFMENMEFLKERSGQVYRSVIKEEPLFPFNIEATADAVHNYVLENESHRCFMHSIYNIQREMKAIFKDLDADTEVVILFGFGCGYALEYLGEMYPRVQHLIVIEPILQLFKEVLKGIDLKKSITKIKQLTLLLNKDVEEAVKIVTQSILREHNKKIDLAYHLSYRSLLKGYYESFNTSFIKNLQSSREGMVNREILKKKWPASVIQNLGLESLPVESVFHDLQGLPVIIIVGGFSLKNKLEAMETLKEKALVIALGGSIPLLQERGVTPHFYFLPYIGSFKLPQDHVPLIYSDHIPSQLLSEYNSYKIKMILRSDVLGQYIYREAALPFWPIQEGPSLINSVVNLLYQARIEKIIFLDLDLCQREQGEGNSLMIVHDRQGEEVFTSGYLLRVKKALEEQIKAYEKIEFLSNEEGLVIGHTQVRPFLEILQGLEDQQRVGGLLEEALEKAKGQREDQKKKMAPTLQKIKGDLSMILTINKKWLKDLKKLHRYRERNMGVQRLLNEYSYLEHHFEGLKGQPLYQQVIMKMLAETFMSIHWATNYTGTDKRQRVEALQIKQTRIAAETDLYVDYLLTLLKDYREEADLDF